jgi:hypothetical protein
MKEWNEFGVNREADESTYRELLSLRAAVHNFELERRRKESSEFVVVLNRIAATLESIEKKMGT